MTGYSAIAGMVLASVPAAQPELRENLRGGRSTLSRTPNKARLYEHRTFCLAVNNHYPMITEATFSYHTCRLVGWRKRFKELACVPSTIP
jgi:hypothetical protein